MPAAKKRPEKSAKAPPKPTAGSQTSRGYFVESRRPLVVLGFLVPMLVIYELGTYLLLRDGYGTVSIERRVIAFNWVRTFFASLGATGQLVAPLTVVALMLGWHVFSGDRWTVRPSVWTGMLAESAILSIPLFVLGGLVAVLADRGASMWLAGVEQPAAAEMVLGLGAGVYEELVFRLMAFAALHFLLHDLLGIADRRAWPIIIAVSSVAFAGYHYLGQESFAWQSFAFRSAAGVWLGTVFLYRGFGIAAGSHAAYDVALALLR